MSDNVNSPAHYARNGIQPIDVIFDWRLSFCTANALKYLMRAGFKDREKIKEDYLKSIWYLKRSIDCFEYELELNKHKNNNDRKISANDVVTAWSDLSENILMAIEKIYWINTYLDFNDYENKCMEIICLIETGIMD